MRRIVEAMKVNIEDLEESLERGSLDVPKELWERLKGFRSVAIAQHVVMDSTKSVRHCQAQLADIQAKLDELIEIHFALHRRLGALVQIELEAKARLLGAGLLTPSTTGPKTALLLLQYLPLLSKRRAEWGEIDSLCTAAQQHLHRALHVVELQIRLADNVRWAQYRG